MADEIRIKKIELAVNKHEMRLNEHEVKHVEDAAWKKKINGQIDMLHEVLLENQKQTSILLKLAPSIDNLAHYAEKTYDVVKPLAALSGIVVKIAAVVVVIWLGVVWVFHKIAALKLSGWL